MKSGIAVDRTFYLIKLLNRAIENLEFIIDNFVGKELSDCLDCLYDRLDDLKRSMYQFLKDLEVDDD